MCGILGLVLAENFTQRCDFQKALSLMNHRGPDGSEIKSYNTPNGRIFLGHKRLAIIELSTQGLQPRESSCGRFVITFNGEIYNYLELRNDLIKLGYIFNTNTDTEVLITAWQEWGVDCLTRLDGMYAFAVYDREKNRITLARDAFGIKPLFYRQLNDQFIFSSELPPIIDLSQDEIKLNIQRSYLFLQWGNLDDTEETFYQDIYHLNPGHIVEYDISTARLSKRKWWSPNIKEDANLSFDDAVVKFRELFLQSVSRQLRCDVKFGAALSGGLDSSSIVCALRYLQPDIEINTFSYLAQGTEYDESYWCKFVEGHIGARPHHVNFSSTEMSSDLDDIVKSQGEPMGGPSTLAQYYVFKSAKENGVTVTLDGQGADELLGGYDGYPAERFQSLYEHGKFLDALTFMNNWSKWPNRNLKTALIHAGDALSPNALRPLLLRLLGRSPLPKWLKVEHFQKFGGRLENRPRYPQQGCARTRRLPERLRYSMTRSRLPLLLRHGDRNSMNWSIESRVPFLTTELAEFALSLPERFLVSSDGETKHILRHAMKGIVPEQILFRKDKIGFAAPELELLRMESNRIDEWLQIANEISFIDVDEMRQELTDIISGVSSYHRRAWRLIMFCRWANYQSYKMFTH